MVTHEFSDILASMSDDDIMALVGPATWANGLRLERNGAVKELLWDQSEDHLEARVKDKGLRYRVRIAHGALAHHSDAPAPCVRIVRTPWRR